MKDSKLWVLTSALLSILGSFVIAFEILRLLGFWFGFMSIYCLLMGIYEKINETT